MHENNSEENSKAWDDIYEKKKVMTMKWSYTVFSLTPIHHFGYTYYLFWWIYGKVLCEPLGFPGDILEGESPPQKLVIPLKIDYSPQKLVIPPQKYVFRMIFILNSVPHHQKMSEPSGKLFHG